MRHLGFLAQNNSNDFSQNGDRSGIRRHTDFQAYLVVNLREVTFYSSFALVLGILGSAIFWYEAVRV